MSGPSLARIVRTLGGDLYAAGRRANVPAPGHSKADRSVSLWLVGDRVIVHCFAGDDWRAVLDDLRKRGLVDADGRIGRAGGDRGRGEGDLSPAARQRRAAQLWSEGVALGGTLSARHLARRGVSAPPEGLRHHPAAPAAIYADRGPRRPALLGAIREPCAGEVVGLEVTYLAPGGDRAALTLPRKTVGLIPPGSAVRLASAGPALLVGEGVFTCLSAAAVFRRPAWALLSTSNLRAWRPPDGVRSVLIAGDGGRDGEASAWRLAGALRLAGVAVAVRFPPAPFGDWNEACGAAQAQEGEEGRVRMGAADGSSGPSARRSDP